MKKYAIAVFLVLVPGLSSSRARTLTQLISDARILAYDNGSSLQMFTNQNVTDWLNQGQKTSINANWCMQNSIQFQLAVGTTYYSLPSDFFAFRRLTLDNLTLSQMTPAALDSRSEGWNAASGRPTYYFVDYSSPNLVGFAPWPGTSTDTGTVVMEYFRGVPDMVLGTDTPFGGNSNLQSYGFSLAYYAAAQMTAMMDRSDLAQAYMSIYTSAMKAMSDKCYNNPNYLPSASAHE